MKAFASIFPAGYTNPPSETQVRAEVEQWIDSVRNIPDDFKKLLKRITCPYMREAYAVVLDNLCEQLEADYDERLGARLDNCWKPYWPERQNSIRRIIRKAREEQEETFLEPLILTNPHECNGGEATNLHRCAVDQHESKPIVCDPKVRAIRRQVEVKPTTIINNYYGAVNTVVNHTDHI